MKKIILMLCLLAVSVTMYGCTSKEIHKDSGLMKITDDNGRQVAFSKKPERIVVLSPSFLELLEVLDGNVVGRAILPKMLLLLALFLISILKK